METKSKTSAKKKAPTSTGRTLGRPPAARLDLSKPNIEVPRLIITGRGQLSGRAMHALRLKPELIERLKAVASGPTYLLVQVALEQMCDRLEMTDAIQVIKAEDLG